LLIKILVEREIVNEIKIVIAIKTYRLNAQDIGYLGPNRDRNVGTGTERAYTRRVALVDTEGNSKREGIVRRDSTLKGNNRDWIG
jgi:hypothetical protein